MIAVNDLKRTHRITWAAGDYAAVAEHIAEAPPRDLIARTALEPGLDVLDVATGTGNIALRAAARGCTVVGLDLTPELFDTARQRAVRLGVTVEWLEGDAEQLPFAASSFDRVLSAFGVQFAPRHQRVADELVRVLRPGGLIAVAAPSRHDSPELAHALPSTPLTFDAERAPALLAELFADVEVERWDAPLIDLPTRAAVRDYLIGKGVEPASAAAAADRATTPLTVIKHGTLCFAR